MIELLNGRLTQWDTGRLVKITANQGETISEIHCYFDGETEGYRVNHKVEGDSVIAQIPNILLQENRTIAVCAVSITEDERRALEIENLHVYARAKPSDYVYTEDEVITIETVVTNALREAKESGDFKGEKGDKGDDGYTPRKYVDYWTSTDKAEIIAETIASLPDASEVGY